MNHIHRLVWNEQTGSWVAVSETARSRGKGSGRTARKAFLAALIASGFAMTSALAELPATTVVPASGKTYAYISANGVPVVNIETANAKGLSHNFYTQYNVEANGLVLNNGNNSQIARQSQLAGQVVANLNLVQEAKVILNEVVSTNRSALAGFTEVLGGKADVIVANPNGITCNGCGFINTDRVTLTTGTSNVAGDGSLTGFSVNRGDVLIEGLGANASTQQIFDIVARSVKLDGKVNVPATNSLGITTGNNAWSYAGRNVTGTLAGSGTAPTFAFDSTVLGGMYAGRINIIATEAGVGVRMLGEAAASADDFTLSSAGKVEIQSSVSAARDAGISTSSGTGNQDLFLNGAGAKLSAGRDLAIQAIAGQVKLVEGELFATRNLNLTSTSLSDVATDVNNVATDAKTRFSGVNTTLVTTGAAEVNGSVWGAGSALSGMFGSFAIGASGATIYAGTTLWLNATHDLSLATAAIRSTGDMTLAANLGAISTTAGAVQGIQTTTGNLSLSAGNGLSNAGTITADTGSVTTRISGTLNNSGMLHAKTMLDMADQAGGTSENVTNSGTLIADAALTAKAASFTNQTSGTVQGTSGTTLTATTLTNAGTFIASNTVGQSASFNLSTLNNSGTLQSTEDLTFNATGTLTNSGQLLASHNLSVLAGTAALAITNTSGGGVMQAGNALTVTGANATFNTQSGTVLGNTVALTLASINNSGTLQSNAGMAYAVGNGVTNSGTLLAKTTLTGSSGSLNNSGTLQANRGSTITTTGALTNSGSLIVSDSASNSATLNVGTLSNTATGVIQSAQSLAVILSGSTLTNAGTLIAANNLTLTSTGSGLTVTNQNGGYLQAGNTTGDTLTVGGTAVVLNNNAGAYILGDQLALNLASLSNAGTIQGGAAVSSVTTSGALTNASTGTLTLATSGAANSSVTANSLNNGGTLQSASGLSMSVTNAMANSGTLYAAKDLTSQSASLSNTGLVQSAQSLAINLSGSTLTNAGTLIAANNLTLTSTGSGLTVTNQNGGYLQAGNTTGDTLTVGGTAVVLNNNAGAYILGDQLALNLASLSNAGTIQGGAAVSSVTTSGALTNASTGTLTLATSGAANSSVTANSLDNSGTLQSASGLSMSVTNAMANSGTLYAAKDLTSQSASLSNTGLVQSAQSLAINLSGSTLTNAGTLIAAHNLTLTSTGSGLTVTNQNGGYLQAGNTTGDTLTVGGTAVVLNNNAGASILGDQLAMNLVNLTNAGTIQGGGAASTLAASGNVTNSGTLNLASSSAGSGTITTDTLNNSGTLQSQGAASINVATLLSNSGSLLTAGAMTVRGTDSAYTLSETGRMQSGGLMSVKGQSGGNGVDITVGVSSVMLGDSMDVDAGTVTVNNGGMVSSMGNMTLVANTLSFGGTTSRIVAATSGTGNANVTLANSFANNGAVHSGGNLTFSAPAITNTNTGGFSALHNLTLTASTGDISNAGALYAGNLLSASTPGTFTNAANTGTVDSDLDISISANQFINNFNVTAGRNITFNTSTFRNEVIGGDTRAWSPIAWGGNNNSSTNSYYSFPDDYEVQYWDRVGVANQYYAGGAPTYKPQILAANTLAITGFNSGYNTGGVLSGQTVTLTGNGVGATFTNNDLSLNRQTWKQTWEIYTHWIALGPLMYDDHVRQNDSGNYKTSEYNVSSIGAGVFASTINATGFGLVNAGATKTASSTASGATGATGAPLGGAANGTSGASGTSLGGAGSGATSTTLGGAATGASSGTGVAGVNSADGKAAVSFGGLVIALPTNPNGYFVISQNSGSKYLVETNPLFNVGSNYVGSDYMAQRYGYNPDTVIKRLGDSNYEAYLIRQQLVSQIGNSIIAGYSNEADQMKRLMDQAVVEGKRMGFTFGQALTGDQVANLEDDVVWMVETTVAGQKVLAPVVYLAAKTRSEIMTGAVIAGDNVNLNLTSVTNTGGTISGAKSLDITSQDDITNTSGTIKGGNVKLISVNGSINNKTDVEGDGSKEEFNTIVGKTAGIISTGTMELVAEKDITIVGANVQADGGLDMLAGGKIDITEVIVKTVSSTSTTTVDAKNFVVPDDTTTTKSTKTTEKGQGSTITVGTPAQKKALEIARADLQKQDDKTSAARQEIVDINASINKDPSSVARAEVTAKIKMALKADADTLLALLNLISPPPPAQVEMAQIPPRTTKEELAYRKLTDAGKAEADAAREKPYKDEQVAAQKVIDDAAASKAMSPEATLAMKKDYNAKLAAYKAKEKEISDANPLPDKSETVLKLEAERQVKTEVYKTLSNEESALQAKLDEALKATGGLKVAATTMTVKGSAISVAGNAKFNVDEDINILSGTDKESETTTTVKQSYFTTAGEGDQEKLGKEAPSSKSDAQTGRQSASASADAKAEVGHESNLEFASTQTTTNTKTSSKNVASTLDIGGNLDMTAGNKLKVQGADIKALGDVLLDAKNIEILAGVNTETESTTTSKVGVGIYNEDNASAEAQAKAKATGQTANAKSDASAEASADHTSTIGVQTTTTTDDYSKTTHTATTLSGNNVKIKAKETVTFQGANVDAKGDLDIAAKDITSLAAVDEETRKTSSNINTAGVYIGSEAKAEASAEAKASPLGGGAEVSAEAKAEVSAGLREANKSETTDSGSKTNVVNSFKAGGNLTRKAEGTITDEGTQLEAGGNIEQSATRLVEKAISDSVWDNKTSGSVDARVGVSAQVGAEASADAKAGVTGKNAGANAGVEASAGAKASVKLEGESESKQSTTAVTSKYKAGGKISSTTTEETVLVGTQFEAGGDIELNAKSLDYKAAKNTSTESKSSSELEAMAKVKLVGTAGGEGEASYAQDKANKTDTTAVVGTMSSTGGSIKIKTKEDTTLEGTGITAEKNVSITSEKGSVNFKAAENTVTEAEAGLSASANLKVGAGGAEAGASGGYNERDFAETKKKAVNIKSNSGDVTIAAEKTVTLEGTKIASANDTHITANEVLLLEAKDVTQETGGGFQANANVSSSSQSVGVDVSVKTDDKQTGNAASITTGGKLTIDAKKIVSQEAVYDKNKTTTTVVVEETKTTNIDKGLDLEFSVDAAKDSSDSKKQKDADKSSTQADSDKKKAVAKKDSAEADASKATTDKEVMTADKKKQAATKDIEAADKKKTDAEKTKTALNDKAAAETKEKTKSAQELSEAKALVNDPDRGINEKAAAQNKLAQAVTLGTNADKKLVEAEKQTGEANTKSAEAKSKMQEAEKNYANAKTNKEKIQALNQKKEALTLKKAADALQTKAKKQKTDADQQKSEANKKQEDANEELKNADKKLADEPQARINANKTITEAAKVATDEKLKMEVGEKVKTKVGDTVDQAEKLEPLQLDKLKQEVNKKLRPDNAIQ